jgi:RNA polymerase sigma-70 factor (ECF subfamily)
MSSDKHGGETDADLVHRLKQNDADAFDRIFEQHRRGMLAYVYGMVGDRGLAEDIVQECFIRLVRNIAKIRPGRSASPWLYRVARNMAIDAMRHRKFEVLEETRDVSERAAQQAERATPLPDAGILAEELSMDVSALLDTLPPRERELVMLRFFAGLTFREIAATVRRPLGTVLWQVRRSLQKLREHMNEHGEMHREREP